MRFAYYGFLFQIQLSYDKISMVRITTKNCNKEKTMIKKINNRSILILLYLTLCFVSGVLYLSSTDLQPDEAHYWVWSTRLQAGYFDNSPLVAFIIRFSTALFGQSEFGVRFPAALSFILLNLILYFFTLRVSEKKSTALLSVFL